MKQYSLTELAHIVQSALSFISADTFWVRAEIASLTQRNGHAYFELVEKSDTGMLAAKMRATCWSSLFPMLNAFFEQETGQSLRAGMQVLLEVEISYHAVYGMSLNIRTIDPKFTLGDLARQRQQTIRQLQQEGLWDLQQQHKLPTLTQRIAVISAAQAAGYDDFCHQLQQSGYRFQLTLIPAVMQGERAEKSLINALQQIAETADEYDVVVIIRGGGAVTDLGCFDSYPLAAACARCTLPILTGIGHTRDISIVDQVAFRALKTPTAVADFLINRFDNLLEQLTGLKQRLKHIGEKQILIRQHHILLLRQRLLACSPERIFSMGYSLTTCNGQIVRDIQNLQAGQTLVTHLQTGSLTSTILQTHHNDTL